MIDFALCSVQEIGQKPSIVHYKASEEKSSHFDVSVLLVVYPGL
jgi:hypothetical protein